VASNGTGPGHGQPRRKGRVRLELPRAETEKEGRLRENELKVINEKGKLGNYPLTLRGDKTLNTGVSLEVL
jgi:hypothetical protein